MKKTRHLLLASAMVFACFPSFGQWLSTTTKSVYHHYAVDAVSENLIYAGGYGGTFLKSDDGGQTWTSLGIGSSDWIKDIHFMDDNNGWVVAKPGTMDPGDILKTTDGGKTWTSVHDKLQYSSMHWPTSSVGYVGTWDGEIVKTTNGGKNWTVIQTPSKTNLHKLFFVDPSYGFAVDTDYKLYRTSNGGTTWDVFSHYGIDAVYFHDKLNGFCVNDKGQVGRTTDGGATFTYWTSTHPEYKLHDIMFSDAMNGIAIGGLDCANGTCTPKPAIFVTHDGGANWTDDSQHPHLGQDIGFYAVDFSPKGAAYIAGSDHIMLRNVKFTSINSVKTQHNDNLSLYPNPTSQSLNIVAKDNSVIGQELVLTDCVGKVMRSWKMENTSAIINIEELATGIYILTNKRNGDTYKVFKN